MSLFGPIITLILTVISLFLLVMIIRAVMGLLFMMDVISPRQPTAHSIYDFSERITEPVIRPVRKIVPLVGGIDLAFLATFLLIGLLREYVSQLYFVLP